MTRNRDHARGFTLVELLVVIAIIGLLAALLTPVINNARQKGYRADCQNNVRSLAVGAKAYADEPRSKGKFPFTKSTGELQSDKDARDCMSLLYKYNQIDDPGTFICKASGVEEEAPEIEDLKERQQNFSLEENNCSFTWNKNLLTVGNSDSNTPLLADKRGGQSNPTNHKDGRNVGYVGGNVDFIEIELLDDASHQKTKKLRKYLIGFDST